MLIKEVRVLRASVADIESASAFYEGRQPDASAIFWDSLLADLELLSEPGHFSLEDLWFRT